MPRINLLFCCITIDDDRMSFRFSDGRTGTLPKAFHGEPLQAARTFSTALRLVNINHEVILNGQLLYTGEDISIRKYETRGGMRCCSN